MTAPQSHSSNSPATDAKSRSPSRSLDLLRMLKPGPPSVQIAQPRTTDPRSRAGRATYAQHHRRNVRRIRQERAQPPDGRQLHCETRVDSARRGACRSAPDRRHPGRRPDPTPPATASHQSGHTQPPPHPTRTRPARAHDSPRQIRDPLTGTFRSIVPHGPTRTPRGSAAPTRTPTGCCASTSPRALTSPRSPKPT